MNKCLLLLLLCPLLMTAEEGADEGSSDSISPLMTVEECASYAIEHNPDVGSSRLTLERAEWRVLAARAKYAFELRSSYDRDIEDETNAYSVTLERTLPSDLNVSATVSKNDTGNEGTASLRLSKVILGGGTFAASNREIQNSIIDQLTANNNHLQRIRQLRLQVTRAYYQVVRSRQTLDIQLRQLERARQNRERAVERDRLLDIANADIQVSENEDRVLQAQMDIKAVKDNLKRVIGMPVTNQIEVTDEFALKIQPQDLDADWDFAQKEHVDFLNYYLNLKKIERDIHIARSELMPRVSLNLDASQASNEDYDFEQDVESSAGVSLSWTFGNAPDRSAYYQALISKRQADIDLFDITQRKLLELRNLHRDLDQLVQRIEIAEKRLELQERSTALYRDRWQNGEIDILEFIRNQDSLENSRVSLLRLKIEYIEKLAEYMFAVGR